MAVVGLPLVVVTLTFLFMALGVVAVTVRTWIRLRLKSFGMDDAMVVFTLLTFIVDVAFTLHGANVGVGTRNAYLTIDSSKWYSSGSWCTCRAWWRSRCWSAPPCCASCRRP